MNLEQIIFNLCILALVLRLQRKLNAHIQEDHRDIREVDQADT